MVMSYYMQLLAPGLREGDFAFPFVFPPPQPLAQASATDDVSRLGTQ